jgi:hypothetical protein
LGSSPGQRRAQHYAFIRTRDIIATASYSIGVFVYWYGPVRTASKSIRLLVRMGSDRTIVGPGRNRLLRTGPFLMCGSNYSTVSPQCGTGTARTVCLPRIGLYQIKMVRTNKQTHPVITELVFQVFTVFYSVSGNCRITCNALLT